MKAIGIDIGTTSICGVVMDTDSGALIRSVTKNSEAFLCGCAPWERIQSVDRIMSVAMEVLDDLVDSDTAVIGVTGQMHGIVYVNAEGEAVSPLYTWQDERGNLPYRDTTYAAYLGCASGYGCVTDLYNRENGLRPQGAVSFCTIHDYFVMKICSLTSPLIHASDAASFGLYDLRENRLNWDFSPETVKDYRIAGKYRGIPVSVAIGDNQASVFSTLADENALLLNVGTGSQVSLVSDTPITAENVETRPYFDGKYLIVGAALCGGRAYSLLKDFYAKVLRRVTNIDDGEVYGIMSNMAESEDARTLSVDTRFAGTRSDPALRGSITDIGTDNFTPASLTRGVLDGMANELYTMYSAMGARRCGVVGSGNGVRKNPALVRALEQKFGGKMIFPAHLEEAAVGAALFGLVACGRVSGAKEAQALIKYNK